ncbi:MAG TPA: hypothetical protein DIC42_05125 [Holosporales bacterium]|nr:hypothetical protein [Holosporales bacterium]
MSLKAYKNVSNNTEVKEQNISHGVIGASKVHLKKNRENSLKSNKFFYMAGLIIFLYGGLKVLDYGERYKGESHLLKQTMHKLLTLFVPQLLTAQESINKDGDKKALPKGETNPSAKTPVSAEENIKTDKDNGIASADDAKTDGVKNEGEDKEAFFDPLGITSESEVLLLEALGARRMQLDEREKVISKRELELELFEKKLTEKWDALQIIQEEVKRQLGQLDKGEIAKEQSLSKLYENMKPKDAARIFDSLDLSVVMKIITHMKEKKLSEIMGFVSTERARDITQGLAFTNQSLAKSSLEGK